MPEYDIVIKDGMIFDGARNPRFRADLGISDGIITAIGHLKASDARRVIDASGMHVAPGFIDLHTHYDAQLFWDPYCSISGWHGATSVVIGNCGFSFAPAAPEMRERAMLSMTRNEAIPLSTMQAGMPWDWETFPEFLDSVQRTPKSVNVLPLVGLNLVMIAAMGFERAKAGEMPTDAEHAEMARLLHEAMDAGACGWSVQRMNPLINVQRDYDGTPMVTDVMHNETAIELAKVLAERNDGFIQMTLAMGLEDQRVDWAHAELLAEISRRPVTWSGPTAFSEAFASASSVEVVKSGGHRDVINWLRSCTERGLRIFPQATTTEAPMFFTLEDWNIWDDNVGWREACLGTVEEKRVKFADPARRAVMKEGPTGYGGGVPLDEVVILHGRTPETAQFDNLKVKDVCALTGKHPVDAVLDIVLADDLKTLFYAEPFKSARGHLREVVQAEYTLPGFSDGGAHTKFFTGGRYTTEYLTDCVRDRAWLSLEEAHWRLSGLAAACTGFRDRGVLKEGARADIVVYDFANLETLPQEIAFDLPGGEWRRIQRAKGYHAILVNGEVTIEDDQETGANSGQLLRHGVGEERTPAAMG